MGPSAFLSQYMTLIMSELFDFTWLLMQIVITLYNLSALVRISKDRSSPPAPAVRRSSRRVVPKRVCDCDEH